MGKRKGISASLRWSVFARDGFACRYCGAQAGQANVELAADHVVSVAEGGENTYDNLVTACQKCNGGKGARSLASAPTSTEVVERIAKQAATLQRQSEAMAAALEVKRQAEQEAVDLKCAAYRRSSVSFEPYEKERIVKLCKEHGADKVLEWYQIAARNVRPRKAIRYVYGIIRNARDRVELSETALTNK